MSFSNYFWAPRRAFRARRPGCSGVPSRLRDQLPTVAALHIPGAFKKVLRLKYQELRREYYPSRDAEQSSKTFSDV